LEGCVNTQTRKRPKSVVFSQKTSGQLKKIGTGEAKKVGQEAKNNSGVGKDLVKREYTKEQKAGIRNLARRLERTPLKFKKNVKSKPGRSDIVIQIEPQETDRPLVGLKMMEALGTADSELQSHFLNQVVQTFRGFATPEGFNYDRGVEFCNNAMALLNGIEPRDEIEGMLAIQMVGVHNLAMETLKRAMLEGQTLEGKEANVNQATKMLRTFTAQMEALKRYRTGGQQKVTVEHVHVNQGGQAIVGNVTQGAGRGPNPPPA